MEIIGVNVLWFEKLVGFKESSPSQVRENITLNGQTITSKVNGKPFDCGVLETPTLNALRERIDLNQFNKRISFKELVGDVQALHKGAENNGALFQVASQFNLLEMVNPNVTPEEGVDRYEIDFTQGPACAIACGAGTIYRNYFVELPDQIGQSADNQIDCLSDVGLELGNDENKLWEMKSGYCIANRDGLKKISDTINSFDKAQYESLMGKLKIGIQWDSQVTITDNRNKVTQAYCSALPVAYSHLDSSYWEDFAKLILNATYEATFYTAIQNMIKTGNNKLYLTLIGGGAFGNKIEWITEAINNSIHKFKSTPLDVRVVSFRRSNAYLRHLLNEWLLPVDK